MPRLRRRVQHVVNRYRQTVTGQLRRPSYTYKRLELDRVQAYLDALGESDPVWRINDKDDAHQWARGLGVRVPALVGVWDRVDDVPWTDLPDRVALKPCRGSTSRGVYLLERRGGLWWDLDLHRELEPSQVVAGFTALADAGQVGPDVLVEELVRDPRVPDGPPVDYKVHTFYGTVGMIEAKGHGGPGARDRTSWRVFDPAWQDLGNVFHMPSIDRSIPPPVHGPELLELARVVSSAVPRAYLRVDLYDDADGPVFGEITPLPGSHALVLPDVDRMLGELWEHAEARLLVRGHRAGHLGPQPGPTPEALLALQITPAPPAGPAPPTGP